MKQTDKDYYRILEVREGASPEELRRAYRRLAKRYHPDVRPNDLDAERRFKEISEAYEVLRDPMKRWQYDRKRRAERASMPQETVRTEAVPGYAQVLRALVGTGRGLTDSIGTLVEYVRVLLYRRKGEDIRLDIRVPLEKIGLGGRMRIRVRRGEICERCGGRRKRGISCPVCGGTGRVSEEYLVPVDIPAGIEEGATLRVQGEGEPGCWGGRAGDLVLTVHIEPHRFFEPRGVDVYSEVPITVAQAILGTRIRVRTLEGKRAELPIPPGTQPGTVFRLRGIGIRRNGARGDQLVRIRVVIPTHITERQKELIEAFYSSEG